MGRILIFVDLIVIMKGDVLVLFEVFFFVVWVSKGEEELMIILIRSEERI